jgi:hypothetical protein
MANPGQEPPIEATRGMSALLAHRTSLACPQHAIARAAGHHRAEGDRRHPRVHRYSRRTRPAHRVILTTHPHRTAVHGAAVAARSPLGHPVSGSAHTADLSAVTPTSCQPSTIPRDPPATFLALRSMCRRSRYCVPRAIRAFGFTIRP